MATPTPTVRKRTRNSEVIAAVSFNHRSLKRAMWRVDDHDIRHLGTRTGSRSTHLRTPTIEELVMSSQHRLFFYNSSDRSGTTVRLDDGGGIVSLHDFAPGHLAFFTHIVSGGSRLFFYNSSDRSGTTVRLDGGGGIVSLHDFAPGHLGFF